MGNFKVYTTFNKVWVKMVLLLVKLNFEAL